VELLSAALAEEALPSPQELLARALRGAEDDATQVYGDVPEELERLTESIEKINSQLQNLDEEIGKLSSEGNFKALRLRIAEREELKGRLALLEGKRRLLQDRAAERERYAEQCYRYRILREIERLEPLLTARISALAEVLNIAIALLNEIPEFRRWSTGLLYWILAHLARESADPNWARLLQGHLPVGWDPDKVKKLVDLYAR
jgi:chromosome segregation ATPase